MSTTAARAVLLHVITPHYHQDLALANMHELEQLVDTFGAVVVEKAVQHRVEPHPSTYIGGGKVEWLQEVVKEKKVDVVILNDLVKAGQIFRLEKALWKVNPSIAVWDRVDLILSIFEKHASSAEAKLQIELARIEHMGPRIYGLGGTVLSRQGAGINTRGKGETNIEFERRKIKLRKQHIQKEIALRTKKRIDLLTTRKKHGVKTVALVGYTSAGKTTLFNTLTKKKKLTDAGLFTTLDTVVGKMKVEYEKQPLILSDTIGFIDNLPPQLIEAFRSTLLESLSADVLLHVVDASDPQSQQKIETVEAILTDLGIREQPLLVMNKIDTISSQARSDLHTHYVHRPHVLVSALTKEGVNVLMQRLYDTLGIRTGIYSSQL